MLGPRELEIKRLKEEWEEIEKKNKPEWSPFGGKLTGYSHGKNCVCKRCEESKMKLYTEEDIAEMVEFEEAYSSSTEEYVKRFEEEVGKMEKKRTNCNFSVEGRKEITNFEDIKKERYILVKQDNNFYVFKTIFDVEKNGYFVDNGYFTMPLKEFAEQDTKKYEASFEDFYCYMYGDKTKTVSQKTKTIITQQGMSQHCFDLPEEDANTLVHILKRNGYWFAIQ